MEPRPYQLENAQQGYDVLSKYMIVYLAMEERTGKTLTSILIAEKCKSVKSVLVVTKKKARGGWEETLAAFPHLKKYTVTNYHQVHKFGKHDLMIMDEAHNYISGYPDQSAMHRNIQNISMRTPIIYLSATPHAQGYQMLYHQLALSSWSPWRTYKDFHKWFKYYGVPNSDWFHGRQVPVYTETKESLVKACVEHLFITSTRKQLGFKHEPVDKLHHIKLNCNTTLAYNELMKDKVLELRGLTLIADTGMKLRTSLHMLEGGVAKIDDEYLVLNNNEKINYILNTWGDTDDLVIYYHYIAEGQKLRARFKHAQILQATSYAEGIDLAHKDTIVVYSQDFSTAKYTQRRARQASMGRDKRIIVHFLLVANGVSEQAYHTVATNKTNFVDSVFDRIYL